MRHVPFTHTVSRFGLARLSIATACCWASAGYCGDVKFDGSLGRNDALPGPNFLIPADAGRQAGGNLFHSFTQFDLSNGESASFRGPASVTNILARVTGGGASSIDGTLRSEISGANLFFLNSAGVVFGPTARLDISGSFTVTTADYVKLSDGGKFNARIGGDDLLTAAPVRAFGFLATALAPVSFTGSQVATPSGQDFTVVAGDLTLDAATLAAPSGRLSLISAAAAGEVPASPDTLALRPAAVLAAMGSIELKNRTTAHIDGTGGGRVVIRGGRLALTGGSAVSSNHNGVARGGNVDVRLTGTVALRGGVIRASTFGPGRGGDISVDAPGIAIEAGADAAGILAAVGAGATGHGGDVTVRSDDLALVHGGQIFTNTFGLGDCGGVAIDAGKLTLDGGNFVTGIFIGLNSNANVRGGDLAIHARDIAPTAGGEISTTIFGRGAGSSIRVSAGTLRIDRKGSDIPTGIFAAVALGAIGHGGNIFVESGDLAVTGGGVISGDTFGTGNSGSVSVSARRLRIDPLGSGFFTGISSSVSQSAVGHGGDVLVQGDDLSLTTGGFISARTFGQGDGGNIQITSKKLTLDGGGFFTGILANVEASGVGRAGNITIRSDDLRIAGGGEISSSTFGRGDGGSVRVAAAKLRINLQDAPVATGIFANVGTGGVGQGGDVFVTSGDVFLTGGGVISTSTFGEGDGGDIVLRAGKLTLAGANDFTGIFANVETGGIGHGGNILVRSGDLTLRGGAISADTNGGGDGGNVTVTGGRLQMVGGAGIAADTFAGGRGGNVTVQMRSIVLGSTTGDDSYISSDSLGGATGRGGDVSVKSDRLEILGGAGISADTTGAGDAGNVQVEGGMIVLDGANLGSASFISSDVLDGASGSGGSVTVHAGHLVLRDSAGICADTLGLGNGGDVRISADDLLLSGTDANNIAFISSEVLDGATGRGGNISVSAGRLRIRENGQISASTDAIGNAGDVRVTADEIHIEAAQALVQTGIGALATAASSGRGGSVEITAGTLRLTGARDPRFPSGIIVSSGTGAPAGSIVLRLDRLSLEDSATISSANDATGDAGSVKIDVSESAILRGGSSITAFSKSADAGTISVSAGRRFELHGDSSITTSAGANGGSIALSVGDYFGLDHSRIVATAGAVLTGGAGGNISIDPTFIVLDHGLISANAALGRGGNIFLRAENFFSSESIITATGATAGIVEIAAPELDLSGGLVILPGALVDASSQLREQCARRLGLDFSSFLVIGRGGVSLAPDEALPPSSAVRAGGENGPAKRRKRGH